VSECTICKGKKVIRTEDGWKECECVFKKRLKQLLSVFLPAPANTASIKKSALGALEVESPKKLIVPLLSKDQYKTWFMNYLVYGDLLHSFEVFTTYRLIDIYVGNVEEGSMYDVQAKTIIILHGFSQMGNKQELNIMNQFIDMYRDRDILAYSQAKDRSDWKVSLIGQGFKQLS